jgi:hypothetical protein
MAAYAVTARIGRVHPQLTVRRDDGRVDPEALEGRLDVPIDVIDSIWNDRFSERLARLQERWTQATFYLFDPESWRR